MHKARDADPGRDRGVTVKNDDSVKRYDESVRSSGLRRKKYVALLHRAGCRQHDCVRREARPRLRCVKNCPSTQHDGRGSYGEKCRGENSDRGSPQRYENNAAKKYRCRHRLCPRWVNATEQSVKVLSVSTVQEELSYCVYMYAIICSLQVEPHAPSTVGQERQQQE